MEQFALGVFREPGGAPFPALVFGDRVLRLSNVPGLPVEPTLAQLLEHWDETLPALTLLAEEARHGDGATAAMMTSRSDLVALPPVPSGAAVFQAGANYREHLVQLLVAEGRENGDGDHAELHAAAEAAVARRAEEGEPYVFLGLTRTMCGAGDDVVLPPSGRLHDWELELAVVIGRRARHVVQADALRYVAGYTICNDITTRDLVYRPDVVRIGTDWLRSKNAPTFLPTGPVMVPAMFVPDPGDLRLQLRLNGELMQDGCTRDMLFDIPRLIEHTSAITELLPGDVLLTGSPQGNGAHHGRYLRPGDVMEAEITGLGRQRNRCVAAPDPARAGAGAR